MYVHGTCHLLVGLKGSKRVSSLPKAKEIGGENKCKDFTSTLKIYLQPISRERDAHALVQPCKSKRIKRNDYAMHGVTATPAR
jgi:hypothetical protein